MLLWLQLIGTPGCTSLYSIQTLCFGLLDSILFLPMHQAHAQLNLLSCPEFQPSPCSIER